MSPSSSSLPKPQTDSPLLSLELFPSHKTHPNYLPLCLSLWQLSATVSSKTLLRIRKLLTYKSLLFPPQQIVYQLIKFIAHLETP